MNKQIINFTIATLALIAGISIANPARAYYIFSFPPFDEDSDNIFLPESIVNSVLQNTSELSGLGMDELEIADYEKLTWSDGCIGFRLPGVGCSLALVPGWVVTVESETQKWIYHTSDDGDESLASHYKWEFDAEQNQWSNYVTSYSGSAVLNFFDFPETQEYDPAKIEGFRYTMTSDSWFDSIVLPAPIAEQNLFTVLTENSTTQVTSTLVENRRGLELNSGTSEEVTEFTITDINQSIDWLEYPAFVTLETNLPIDWLELDSLPAPTYTYKVEVLEKSEYSPKPAPEPSTIFSLLTLGILGLFKSQKIQNN